jgi:hypothetical protein
MDICVYTGVQVLPDILARFSEDKKNISRDFVKDSTLTTVS